MTAALESSEWSAARPGHTLPPGKTRYPFYRTLVGPQGRSGRAENLVPTGIRSRTVQPVVSRYTDWATGPTFTSLYLIILHYKNRLRGISRNSVELTYSSWPSTGTSGCRVDVAVSRRMLETKLRDACRTVHYWRGALQFVISQSISQSVNYLVNLLVGQFSQSVVQLDFQSVSQIII